MVWRGRERTPPLLNEALFFLWDYRGSRLAPGLLFCRLLSRIGHHAILPNPRAFRQSGRVDSVLAHQMKDALATRDEMIRDDPPMATPPDRLGTHDGTDAQVADLDKLCERFVKWQG